MKGFRTRLSAQDSVQDLVSDIEFHRSHDRHILIVFLDIDKAFDSVCVAILRERLAILGLRGRITQFLENYLSNRSFTVKLGNTFISPQALPQGLPQGCVLSPLLFNVVLSMCCPHPE